MNIGVDIDGVLIDDDEFLRETISKFLYEKNLGQLDFPTEYEAKTKFFEKTEIQNEWREQFYYRHIKNAAPRMFAAEVLKKLQELGHKIFIVTGRFKVCEESKIGKFMRSATERWLKDNKIPFDKICFTTTPKLEAIRENKIDLMIDDSPEVLPEINGATKVFCYNNFYNQNISLPNMTRVFSWYDILLKIEKL